MANKAGGTTGVVSDSADLSISIGDYLKTIWRVAGEGAASTGDIARELGVTAPSVTGMLVRMKGLGLVGYQPYKGAELTEQGRREVMRLLRRHRVLETFMIEHLGFGWDEVHVEAERMEHAMSDEFTDRLARHLGHPSFDPHGDPIPRGDGSLPDSPAAPLSSVPLGAKFRVYRVLAQDRETLSYLTALGIEPGCELLVVGVEPTGRLMRVVQVGRASRHGGSRAELAISTELAGAILGESHL
jgi:DtxR family Mn-dependent transcriptional regulator